MKILFATKNEAKLKKYEDKLKQKGVELLSIKDLDVEVSVKEDGKNSLENAFIKAKAYYEATGMITIGMDDNLFIKELPEEKQPGTNVRRVNGKRLTDDEMIEYYTGLVKQYGGKLTANWVYSMVIYNGKETKEKTWEKDKFYFVDKPCEKRDPGYPLSSISVVPKYNKYWIELTEEDLKDDENAKKDDEVVDFIVKSIQEL